MGKLIDFKKALKIHKNKPQDPFEKPLERCVLCGGMTDVSFDTPIQERKHYVPGAGQLCEKCCINVYGTNDLRSLQSSDLDAMFE